MMTRKLEKQLFKLQDISQPFHQNKEVLSQFIEKQISFWVIDAGFDPAIVDDIVNILTPLMGQLNHSNIYDHMKTIDEILSHHLGVEVEINWIAEDYRRSA